MSICRFNKQIWFLQWWGWEEVRSKNLWVSVGLTNKSVLSSQAMSYMFRSKKLTSSLKYSAVNFIVWWNKLTWSIKSLGDSSPCSQKKNMQSIYLHQMIVFCFKNYQQFFVDISHIKNSITRRKLASNSGSTFFLKGFFQIHIHYFVRLFRQVLLKYQSRFVCSPLLSETYI